VENQITLGAGDTLIAKQTFEDWLRDTAEVEIQHINSDNGVLTAEEFRDDCKEKSQKQTFSGVGAQHQNAKAERAIQTVMWMARTFMLHVSLHWTERGVEDIALWGFAVKHAAWLYNRIPNRVTSLTPMELLTNVKADHRDLLQSHVWGCPCYVLDPTLQSGKKIPKWNHRSRMGQFLGFSEEHSSLVARVRNLETCFVSPQYHVVFDDRFETVFSSGEDDEVIDRICQQLFEDSRDVYVEPEYNDDGDLVYSPPPLDEVWLSEPERRERKTKLRDQRIHRDEIERLWAESTPSAPLISRGRDPAPIISDDERSVASDSGPRGTRDAESEGDGWVDHPGLVGDEDERADAAPSARSPPAPNIPANIPEGVAVVPEGDDSDSEQAIAPRRARRRRRREHGPAQWTRDGRDGNGRKLRPNPAPAQKVQYGLTFGAKQVPPRASTLSKKKRKYRQRMALLREKGDADLQNMPFDIPSVDELMKSPLAKFIHLAANDCGYRGSQRELIATWVHPLFLKAKTAASKLDNPNWRDAMRGDYAEEFWEACKTEIATLEGMNAWEVVDRTPEMNVIASTWAFKIKRFPDGLIKKFKARFCARGDQQIEGVDFFETYAPVVQWTTVRMMLILEVLLDLKSKQGDVTAAFLHAELGEDEEVYVEMPTGFKQEGKCLCLRRTLYGLRQSPRAF